VSRGRFDPLLAEVSATIGPLEMRVGARTATVRSRTDPLLGARDDPVINIEVREGR
jgi:hypothetical protein